MAFFRMSVLRESGGSALMNSWVREHRTWLLEEALVSPSASLFLTLREWLGPPRHRKTHRAPPYVPRPHAHPSDLSGSLSIACQQHPPITHHHLCHQLCFPGEVEGAGLCAAADSLADHTQALDKAQLQSWVLEEHLAAGIFQPHPQCCSTWSS